MIFTIWERSNGVRGVRQEDGQTEIMAHITPGWLSSSLQILREATVEEAVIHSCLNENC